MVPTSSEWLDFSRIVGVGCGVGRIEQQDAAVSGAKARRQIPVLALDIMDDAAARPSEQRRDDETHAFAGTGRRKAENMLGTIVP